MSKTLIGVVSYGGLKFLECFLRSVQETLTTPNTDLLVVVAKPGDDEMKSFLDQRGLRYITNETNVGFPGSCNDLYDVAFVNGDYDNLIFCGNDIVVMPGAIDSMIRTADATEWMMVCGSEFNSRFLFDTYPESRRYFDGPNLIVKTEAFTDRIWEMHGDFRTGIEPYARKDIRNFTLFKRSAFEKVGYDDINFQPNGYFSDNDYCRRCDLERVSACGLKEASFFHWTSRTLLEGEERGHWTSFERNRVYYTHKWHGEPGQEKLATPFGGGPYRLGDIEVPCDMRILSRAHEQACIEYWSKL